MEKWLETGGWLWVDAGEYQVVMWCVYYRGRNIRGLHNGVNVVGSLSVEALYDGVMGSLLLGSTLGRRGLF